MKIIKYILSLSILIIVVFVCYNKQVDAKYWNLMWNSHMYMIIGLCIGVMWVNDKSIITRSLLIALGCYYCFELTIDIIDVFNHELKLILYKGKYINYILGLSMGIALLILALINKIKKWISS